MSAQDAPVRERSAPCDGPAAIDVALGVGRVRVHLLPAGEPGALAVRVEPAGEPAAELPDLVSGIAGMLGFLDRRPSPGDRVAAAVAATELGWDAGARTLTVRGPRAPGLRTVPLVVTVRAPDRSAVTVRAGAAPVRVSGRAGEVSVRGTGGVTLDVLAGRTDLRTGAGRVRVERVDAPLRVAGGAGDVRLDHVHAPAEIVTGAGRIRLGEVHADAAVRAAAGDVEVADAVSGELELSTGAGRLSVGVHAGVDARVDLRARVGSVTSDLPVRRDRPDPPAQPPGGPPRDPLRIRARTEAGAIVVTRARPRPALAA